MKNAYQTRDLYLAAFLLLAGQKLTGTRQTDRIVYFMFPQSPATRQLTLDYFAGNTSVEPLAYIESLKRLRHLVKNRLINKHS